MVAWPRPSAKTQPLTIATTRTTWTPSSNQLIFPQAREDTTILKTRPQKTFSTIMMLASPAQARSLVIWPSHPVSVSATYSKEDTSSLTFIWYHPVAPVTSTNMLKMMMKTKKMMSRIIRIIITRWPHTVWAHWQLLKKRSKRKHGLKSKEWKNLSRKDELTWCHAALVQVQFWQYHLQVRLKSEPITRILKICCKFSKI